MNDLAKQPLNYHLKAILAITKKDVRELLPIVLLSCAVFMLQPIIVSMNFESDPEFWTALQANFYYVGYFLGTLLMISVLQQDPAASIDHDWLTRPIARLDWLLAKLLFLLLTVCIPVILSRFLINLSNDFGLGLSLSYALGVEKLGGVLPVPLLLMMALLAPTLRKLIFLLTLVLIVFLVPSWSVTRPLLSLLGIELGAEYGAMMWLQALPILAAGTVGSLLIYWLFYCRREQRRAYIVFCVSVAIIFFSLFTPTSLYNWDRAISLHTAMINGDDELLENSVVLEHVRACFPAATGGSSAGSGQNNSVLTQAAWVDGGRRMSDAGGVTFATTVRAREVLVDWFQPSTLNRELPVGWRIDRVRVQGRFSADSLDEDVVMHPSTTALNRYAPISSTDTDYWIIPVDAVGKLADDPSTRLTIEYDLALLSPTTYELKTDGQRRNFAELGSCKADVDYNANSVEVDCLKRGVQPELMSAQLIGLEGSRVDNWPRSSFTADWLEAFGRTHYEVTLLSPNLVDSSSILLTAYNVERILKKELVSEGVLGDSLDICPLPNDEQYAAIERSNWSDKSLHEVSSVAVERDVRVEVLDWRSETNTERPTLVLLPGLGATAHSYDELAPKLAENYQVIAITRRGIGASSKPDHGYDIARLSQDVMQVLNTLDIESPVLVGHSIAGEELSYLGAHFAEHFAGLIYLDAAYDRTHSNPEYRALSIQLPDRPPPRPAEFVSYETAFLYAQRIGQSRNIPEGELLASYNFGTGAVQHDIKYLDAIMMGLQAPEYERISIPALGIYAVPGSAQSQMEAWYDHDDPVLVETVNELFRRDKQTQELNIARFREGVADSEVLAIVDADHWIFLSHEDAVLDAIHNFVEKLL